MNEFIYTAQPARVVFGDGSLARVQREVEILGCRRAMVICTPRQRGQAEAVSDLLGPLAAGIYDGAQMHVPIESVRAAMAYVRSQQADCTVAIGGGSTVGLAKAIARECSLPIIAVPTTYAGSEMTPIFGITEGRRKTTGRDMKVLPRTVLYDPALSMALPLGLSIVSGINAIAHAAEGLYARDVNPVMVLMAEEGIRAMAGGLRGIHARVDDRKARSDCLYGAWLCGTVLGHVGMALHHKLCHTLGGTFNLPHAETHTIVLPHVLAYNSTAAPEAMARIARALDTGSAAQGMFELAASLGAPLALRDIGMEEADIDEACAVATANPYWNPRPVDEASLRMLLKRAWAGETPAT